MLPEEIIVRPVVTEKSNDELQLGKYTFEVNKKATKVQIAKAVEKLFEVKVLNVNTMIVKGKTKRVRYQEGKTPDWKKAIVTIDTNPSDKTYLGKGGKSVKVSKTRKRMRRAHNAMEMPGVTKCSTCGEVIKPHRVCPKCGSYKGKEVVSVKEAA